MGVLVNVTSGLLQSALTRQPSSLLYTNPVYRDRSWWREFGRISYLGGREYAEPANITIKNQTSTFIKNEVDGVTSTKELTNETSIASMLFRHERETESSYFNRRQRAYYNNVVRTAANALVSHALKLKPTRKGDDLEQKFWSGVDPFRSMAMDKFVKRGAQMAEVQGIMWACVDQRPTKNGGDGIPYAYWVSPLDILDWDVDEFGNIIWLKQFGLVTTRRRYDEQAVHRFRFRIWERRGITTWETNIQGGDVKNMGSVPNEIGVVPFVPLYSIREEDSLFPDGHARLGDFCKAANHCYNMGSLLAEICYKQTFSWMIFPSKDVDVLQTGTGSGLGWDAKESGGAMPQFVSPDAEQARVLMETIRDVLEQARQGIALGRGRQEGSMEKSTAEALELESEDKRSVLQDIAEECQDFERRLVMMFNRYRNKVDLDAQPTIAYQMRFDTRSFKAEIDEALAMEKLMLSPEVKLKLVEQLVGRKFDSLTEDEKQVLIKTLKAEQEKRMQNAAASGAPTGDDADRETAAARRFLAQRMAA